jgi:hypothetical protein
MVVIVYCGVLFGSIRYASELWASALSTLLIVILLTAVICAILQRGSGRAGWLGFAVFGWGFFLLVDRDESGLDVGSATPLTSILLRTAYERTISREEGVGVSTGLDASDVRLALRKHVIELQRAGQPPSARIGPDTDLFTVTGDPLAVASRPTLADFMRVGSAHAVFLWGLLGAALGRWIGRRTSSLPHP